MFHILICDDDEKYIEYLINLFLKEGLSREESLFYRFTSGEELVASLEKQGECDLLILDMQMKDYDGHKTARLFRNYFPNSVLVFCSGVRKPTDESFKTMPFRYLMKDYSEIKMCSEIRDIIKRVKELYPQKDIWCYTGYLFDQELLSESRARCEVTDELLSYIDVLVDGKFIEELKDLSLKFRGSSNQRIIDVKQSLEKDEIILYKDLN